MEKEFDYNGNELRYLFKTSGAGDDVILMHGYHFKAETWEESNTINILSDAGFNTYSLDMPGYPNSKSRFDLDDDGMVDLIEKFRRNVIGSNIHLLGASASGYYALLYAMKHQDKLKSLVLVAPADTMNLSDEKLEKIKVDVLLIYGSEDGLIRDADRLKELMENSKIEIIKGTHHACYLEKPTEFNEILKEFLMDHISTG